jgi:hypothetical protein
MSTQYYLFINGFPGETPFASGLPAGASTVSQIHWEGLATQNGARVLRPLSVHLDAEVNLPLFLAFCAAGTVIPEVHVGNWNFNLGRAIELYRLFEATLAGAEVTGTPSGSRASVLLTFRPKRMRIEQQGVTSVVIP